MNIKLMGAIVAVLVVAGGVYALTERAHAPGMVACTQDAQLCPDGSAVGRTGPDCEFAACPGENTTGQASSSTSDDGHTWTFEEAELAYDGTSATRVFVDGKFVGSYDGSCSQIEFTSWKLLPGESSGVICWWAGGGHEVGIFGSEVKVGDLDEGSAEVAGTRGNFKTVFTLPNEGGPPSGITDCDVPPQPAMYCKTGTLEFVPSGGALHGGTCEGSWECVQGL